MEIITNLTLVALNSTLNSSDTSSSITPTAAERAAKIFSQPIDVITFVLSIVGLIANAMSVVATVHIPDGQSAHPKLIISLGVSDSLILVSILFEDFMSIFSKWEHCEKILQTLMLNTAVLATLVNLLVMAVNHYLAIMKPLHYHGFMSNLRGNIIVIAIWGFSIMGALLEIIVGAGNHKSDAPFCEAINSDDFHLEVFINLFIFVVLAAIVIIYVRIYILVKNIMLRESRLYQNELHSVKAIVTTMLIVGTFILFWAPHGTYQVYIYIQINMDKVYVIHHVKKLFLINDILFLVLLFNSLADPLIYAVRLKEVQQGYKTIFYKLFPSRRFWSNERGFRKVLSSRSLRRDTLTTGVPESISHDILHEKRKYSDHDDHFQESSFIAAKNNGYANRTVKNGKEQYALVDTAN